MLLRFLVLNHGHYSDYGVRPRECNNVGTQTNTTYVDQWFIPNDYLAVKIWDKVAHSSGNNIYSADISGIRFQNMYCYFHCAGINLEITEIWLE